MMSTHSHPLDAFQSLLGRNRGTLLAAAGLLAAAVVSAAPCHGQAGSDDPHVPKLTAQELQARGLNPEPTTVEALGLTVNLPAGASVVAERANGQLVLSVADDVAMPTWTIRIHSLVSTLVEPSAAAQIEEVLQDLNDAKQPYKLIANGPRQAGGVKGQLCFIARTAPQGQPYIAGWLVLPTSDHTFLVFSIQTLPEHLPQVRPLFEAAFDTILLRSADELVLSRLQRLEAGKAFLNSITPEQLKSLAGLSQWLRIYRHASDGGGTVELGYSLMEVKEAKKGELTHGRSVKSYDADAKKAGIMVHIRGRIVVDKQRGVFYDSEARYWMAWDQSEEAWSILGTHRQGEAEQTEAETGVRRPYMPATPPRLTVVKADNATNMREPYEWETPEVYMSQPIGWLLPRLLPKNIKAPQEFSTYFYNFTGRTPQVTQRVDIWRQASDGSGKFELITRLTSDAEPVTSIYDRDGSLVRRVHNDGTITEPIELHELRRIWQRSGLPLSSSGR